MYGIQALWSAAHYRIGVLFVVLANGRYAIMDRLAERMPEAKAPWPAFDEISVAGLALAMGCAAMTVADLARLEQVFDEVLPDLANRQEPLLLEVTVEPDPTFNP
jgi:benzoylformate decarboxylase